MAARILKRSPPPGDLRGFLESTCDEKGPPRRDPLKSARWEISRLQRMFLHVGARHRGNCMFIKAFYAL